MRRLFIILLSLSLAFPALAQTRAKRLILKDGSYQSATRWTVTGDRVKYFSAERYVWEELPKAMVDWPATEAYERERAGGKAEGDTQARSEYEKEQAALDARTPVVAPGLKLPDAQGVYLLDVYNGQPQLVELVQSGSEVNKQMGKNIIRAVLNPLPGSVKQTVELKGKDARSQSHRGEVVLFVNLTWDDDDTKLAAEHAKGEEKPDALERYRIIRMQEKPEKRIVSNLQVKLTGKIKENQDFVATRAERFTTDWLKITVAEPLAPGEYALIEMLGPKQMNLYVWDFGVDESAPANASAWRPKVRESKTGTDESPVLTKRP